MSVLRSSPYVTIEHLEGVHAVQLVRSELPFGSVLAAREELSQWGPALAGLDPDDVGLLLDFRLTPMTSDPDILAEVVKQVDAVALRFRRRAILLSGLHGPQAERIARAGAAITPFLDEASAWAHVTDG